MPHIAYYRNCEYRTHDYGYILTGICWSSCLPVCLESADVLNLWQVLWLLCRFHLRRFFKVLRIVVAACVLSPYSEDGGWVWHRREDIQEAQASF